MSSEKVDWLGEGEIEIVWPISQDAMMVVVTFSGSEIRNVAESENRLYMLLRERLMTAAHAAEDAARRRFKK